MKRHAKAKGPRGYFDLNLPGQDVKAGRRLIGRPLRYRLLVARLNTLRLDAGCLQESTTEARRAFDRRNRWESYAGTTNEPSGVGNAVVWRTDRLRKVDAGQVVLSWAGATRDALYLPWVELAPRNGGPSFTLLAGHLPYAGYRGATPLVRVAMSVRVATFLEHRVMWLAGFDWNDGGIGNATARRAGGRTVAEHGVDSLIASRRFHPRRPRVKVRGFRWRFTDHALVTVRGSWR